MITNKELFSEKYINLFIPGDGVEFIYSILQNSGITDFASSKSRVKGLEIISTLFSMELIEVFHWGEEHEVLKNKNLSKAETLDYIEKVWFVGADFPDFYAMPMFNFKDWYVQNLEKMGLDHYTDWEWFVRNKIGNLEKWIEENRPNTP